MAEEEGSVGAVSDFTRIVIRGTHWLGDAVITIPAVRALRSLFPSASISMIAPENLAELWGREGSVNRVIPIGRPTGLAEKTRLIRSLRGERFDLGVLFPNSFESALWFYCGGVRERLGYSTCGRGLLLTRRVPPPRAGGHQVRRYCELVRTLGGVRPDAHPSLAVPADLRAWARERLRRDGIDENRRVLGINPGSTYGSAKCWPAERFSELITLLASRSGAVCVVVGGARERALAGRICAGAGAGALNLAGETTVMQLAALITRCSAFVSNDTGPMHLACAVGTPVVGIIGPTDPDATGPLGKSVILRKRVACAPCLKRECPTDHRCMTGISAEEVCAAAEQLMGDLPAEWQVGEL